MITGFATAKRSMNKNKTSCPKANEKRHKNSFTGE
jgi:hypothetical protein